MISSGRDARHVLARHRVEPGAAPRRGPGAAARAPLAAARTSSGPAGSRARGRNGPSRSCAPSRAPPAGTGSAAIFRSTPAIVATASSMRVDVDARLRVERAGVGVAVVQPEDVVGEPAPLAHLAEEARRHPAAERGREQLDRVAVGMVERQAVRRRGRRAPAPTASSWTPTRPFAYGATGSGSPVSASARSPSSSCARSSSPSPMRPADAEHHARRLVPPVEVADEGLARRGADRLLACR